MLVYATPSDLAAWTGTNAPTNAAALLRVASLAVREATELCYYAVDSTGAPSDATQKQAFNDATCCHAAALAAFTIDPSAGGALEAGGVESSTGIGSARITFGDAAAAVEAQQRLLTGLAPDATRILRDAGIVPTAPWVVG